uniref:Uncharacterized protein n=1 Tax=Arundo donax TaxID=35708 RepID=A0A0A9FT48_ARUDO
MKIICSATFLLTQYAPFSHISFVACSCVLLLIYFCFTHYGFLEWILYIFSSFVVRCEKYSLFLRSILNLTGIFFKTVSYFFPIV